MKTPDPQKSTGPSAFVVEIEDTPEKIERGPVLLKQQLNEISKQNTPVISYATQI
jgi:hypothetical protein